MKIKNQNRIKKKKSPPKSLSQHKSKQKSKQKTKKFNPLQYLNALIQLTNDTNALKVKKNKLPQKRDLSSALTIATPAMQKTISTSKIRCKSSYSQYRKKSTTSNVSNLRQVLNVNLSNYMITEQEDSSHCIKFTSMQSANNSKQQTPMGKQDSYNLRPIQHQFKNPNPSHFNHLLHQIDYDYFARKIQRAWKSFQTYKMIHKYYRHFKKQKRQQKQQSQQQRKLQYTSRNNHESPINSHVHNGVPSVYAYLNDYYDIPIQSHNHDLSVAHQQLLQKTVKFKIRNSQTPINNKHQLQPQQKAIVLKRENSESENQLNLTQKLNQIKQYIEQESLKQNQDYPQKMQEIPTIQIKKFMRPQSHHLRQQPNSISRSQNSVQQDDNESTEKKQQNLPLSLKVSSKHQSNISQSGLAQFQLNRSLDRSPTLKQDFASLKKQTHNKNCPKDLKPVSLVDSMIRKQTQKYNQIMSLIEVCKIGHNKPKDNTSNILTQLLTRLEQHKSQLQGNKKYQNKMNSQSRRIYEKSNKQASSCGNNSFLAFQSKDIYQSFEDYEFNSEEKQKIRNSKNNSNTQFQIKESSVQSQHQHNNKQKSEIPFKPNIKSTEKSQNSADLLKRFSNLLDSEEKKLTQFIKGNSKQQLQFQIDSSYSSSKQSQSYFPKQLDNKNYTAEPINQKMIEAQSYQKELNDTSSIYSICPSECQSDAANKMFNQHLNLILIKKHQSTQNLIQLVNADKIPKESFQAKLQQIEEKFNNQRKSIEVKKQKYLKILNSVKKQSLQFQKNLVSSHKKNHLNEQIPNQNTLYSSLSIRKSFSAQSTVLKCILEQPIFTTKDIEVSKFLIRQEDIEQSDYSQDQSNQQTPEKLSENSERDIKAKIDHKQNIISHYLNQFQNLSSPPIKNQNLLTNSDNNETDSELLTKPDKQTQLCVQVNNVQQNKIMYTEQVWVKVDKKSSQNHHQSNPIKEQQHQQINTTKFTSSTAKLQESQDAKSETQDQLLMDQTSKLKSQHSDVVKENSNINKTESPYTQVSSALMQRCSEQLQKLIENQLINQLLQTIYMNESMLTLFKPFIQEIFQFKQITDETIITFVQTELPTYFPSIQELTQRANQKINPTSLQILRLVRDPDFEIDGYELILSEDIFQKARKSIQFQYELKIKKKKSVPIKPSIELNNIHVSDKVHRRETEKRQKVERYLIYERDMKILYMRAVFNCLNNFLIEQKAIATHINTRSTIGTGELSLSIKQFDVVCEKAGLNEFLNKAQQKIKQLLRNKCMLPSFKNYKEVGLFQKQMLKLIKSQLDETEYKWVTYIDQVLEIWNELACQIVDDMIIEASYEMVLAKQKQIKL